MSENKNNENDSFSIFISGLNNQELKVLLLKLKNEIKKPDVSWNQIKNILKNISKKDNNLLKDVIPLILND
ncbi:MAG: hypothetical protein ACR2NW_06245 [Thermodesulfobacteriota bacterium]